MFKLLRHKSYAVSHVEYMSLIVFIIAILLVFQRYVYRGIAGSWKKAGDTFGHGRQFDPRPFGMRGHRGGTRELFFDYTHCRPGYEPPCPQISHRIYNWIDRRCIEAQDCDCAIAPEDSSYRSRCTQCYWDCRAPLL